MNFFYDSLVNLLAEKDHEDNYQNPSNVFTIEVMSVS